VIQRGLLWHDSGFFGCHQSKAVRGILGTLEKTSHPHLLRSIQGQQLTTRFWLIDALKFLGAQLILLHHLSIYGPISDEIGLDYSIFLDEFTQITRLAVPLFLVISGYLTAKGIAQMRELEFWDLLLKRYARLAPFYLMSLGFCVIVNALLQNYLWGSWVPEFPTLSGFLAHAFLLQDVLDVPAISSGVWYVAIDFQLFALTMLVLKLGTDLGHYRVGSAQLKLSLALLCLLSLWVFNLHETLDNWALYFFGTYALGLFAHWAHEPGVNRRLFYFVWFLGALSLVYEPRIRILTALVVSMVLFIWAQRPASWLGPRDRSALSILGDSAYSVFLNHFALILVFTSLWNYFEFKGLCSAIIMTLMFWATAIVWGVYLHLRVERFLQGIRYSWMPRFNDRIRQNSVNDLQNPI